MFGAAALLVIGVLSAAFAYRLRAPGLLLFLALGMLIGDDGLNLISLGEHQLPQTFGVIALAVILFEGGLVTKPGDLRRAAPAGIGLATVGVVVTAGVVAGAVLALTDLDATTAWLIGAVVSSTDATAVFSLLRNAPLPRSVAAVLRVESGLNDPMAVLLTIGVLETWRADPHVGNWALFAVLQLGVGLAVGAVVGLGGSWLLQRVPLGVVGLYPVLALGMGGVAYGAAASLNGSGFLAVYIAGILIGALVPRHRRAIRSFHEGLSNTAEIGLFLLLGVLVFPSELPPVALSGLGIAVVLLLLARPIAVFVTMAAPLLRRTLSLPEAIVISWAGLRGAVPIVLATFPLTAGYPQGRSLFNTVFFVVLVSAAIQGSTVAPLARRLGLRDSAGVWAPIAEALPLEGVDADLVEVDVTADLAVAGQRLRDVPLPAGALATAIVRDTSASIPTADTRLAPGDRVIIAVPRHPGATAGIVAWARGEGGAGERSPGVPARPVPAGPESPAQPTD
ncbi:MAG TPA: potassium/proton antiporter [Egibacteraceae bacterium]|nr:potassium/proton antiporter [Egibacteraceae bacterium]